MAQLSYLDKIRGDKVRSGIAYPKITEILISGLGGLVIIGLLYFLQSELSFQTFIIPFGASAVLVFAAPAAPFSQPRNVVGGHVIAALTGVAVFSIFGQTNWWVLAIANGVAIALMVATKTVHPPAGATALIPVLSSIGNFAWPFMPVMLGAAIIVLVGVIYNNLMPARRYPSFWF